MLDIVENKEYYYYFVYYCSVSELTFYFEVIIIID